MWSFFSRDPSKEFSFDILDKASGPSGDNLWTLHKAKKKVNIFNLKMLLVSLPLGVKLIDTIVCNQSIYFSSLRNWRLGVICD